MEEGKIIFAKNLIFCLNKGTSNYFLDYNSLNKQTRHLFVKIWRKISLKKQVYNNYRLKHHKTH